MKTGNWQIKVLMLFMAAIVLCLTVACGDDGEDWDPAEYPYPDEGLLTVSLKPCEIEVPLIRSREYSALAKRLGAPGEYISDETFRHGPGYWAASISRQRRLSSEFHRIWEALNEQEHLIQEFPHFIKATVESAYTPNGDDTDKQVVVVHLEHQVDLREVEPEFRIPNCIGGVPVHIIVGNEWERWRYEPVID